MTKISPELEQQFKDMLNPDKWDGDYAYNAKTTNWSPRKNAISDDVPLRKKDFTLDAEMLKELRKLKRTYGNLSRALVQRVYKVTWEEANRIIEAFNAIK